MTVFTKLSSIIRKPKITNTLLVEKNACEEEKVEIHGAPVRYKKPPRSGLYVALLVSMLTIVVFTMGMILNQTTIRDLAEEMSRCSIMIPKDLREIESRRANKVSDVHKAPRKLLKNVQLISTREEAASDEIADALREDLDIHGPWEKISVMDNGHIIDFIHDFENNTTTIVDKERCFVMQLRPEWVLPPAAFMAALRRGDAFDVSRERSRLRAAPAPAAAPASAPACAALPAYWLHPDDAEDAAADARKVHKRSAEVAVEGAAGGAVGGAAGGAQFVHFAGRRVQEIVVTNLRELLQQEAALR